MPWGSPSAEPRNEPNPPLEGADAGAPAAGSVGERADLVELRRRRALLDDAARPEAVAKRHGRGQRTARANVADLCDPGSFEEWGGFAFAAQESRRPTDELQARTPADGLITGVGTVNGGRSGPIGPEPR
ncbi:MAG: carboxyl transferase domain-containing protein [Acidimicrobiales bacterium]